MNTDASRLYLGLFLPLLSAERVKDVAPHDTPFALVEKQRGSMRVAALDARALALGLEIGLTLADARARVPELAVLDHDPAADARLLDWLADACDRYTPSVMVDPPAGLVLDLTGCAHPYGSGERLAQDLHARLGRIGLTAHSALAVTADAAMALAIFGGSNVATLPITAIRAAPDVHHALARAGLKTVAAVAAIPAAVLAARFGEALPVTIDRLVGRIDARIVPRRIAPQIEVEARFAEPIVSVDAALGTISVLTAEAAVELSGRGGGGRRFAVALFRSDGHVARITVETATPVREPGVVERLLRERIGALTDPLDPGFGYDLIRLAVPVVDPLAPEQLALEQIGDTPTEAAMTALVDRLSARLGRRSVRRLVSADTHIPEQAMLELPAVEAAPLRPWPQPEPGEPPLRPLYLFDPPQRIEAIAEVPDGPPRRFRWRRDFHEIVRQEGPERIAAEWWRRADGHAPGKGGLTRDYYRVEDARGRRFWVFRHGLYGAEKANPDWYVHGVFA